MERLEVRLDLVIPGTELRESASRSSGPGGQHVNKASTRVTLRWNPDESDTLTPAQRRRLALRLKGRLTRAGDLMVHAQRFRSRARNRELARARLAELVREGLAVQRTRLPTRPGRASRDRQLDAKRRRSAIKQSRSRRSVDDA